MITYSIIQKSQLEGALRIDAEYYQPDYLRLDKKLYEYGSRLKTFDELLEKGNSLTGGATPLGANYPEKGIKFLRVQNIMPGYFDLSDIVLIDEKVHSGLLRRSRLIDDDVLLTITGVSYGKANVYKEIFGEANINQHSVRMHFVSTLISEYVSTFLNSKYGHFQSDRKITGNSRPALAYEEIRNYKIPVISLENQHRIKDLCGESLERENDSIGLYGKAEDLLLEGLGLRNFEVEDNLSFVVNLSDVKRENRSDSAFFQPKYEKLIKKLKSSQIDLLMSNFDVIKSKNFEYEEEGNVGVIKTKQLGDRFVNFEVEDKTREETVKKEKLPILTDSDVVFASMGVGSLGKTNIYYKFESSEEYVIDSTLRIFRKKNSGKVLPEVLDIYFNSRIGQELIYKYVVGSSGIISIYETYLQNFLIPILSDKVQQEIAGLVRKSHEARKKSKELLAQAKKEVEEMIEKGGEN